MDPLSVIASCIAIATLAKQTCDAFSELRSLVTELPDRIAALSNEVADFELVLLQVAKVAEYRESFRAQIVHDDGNIPILLGTAKAKMEELRTLTITLTRQCVNSKGLGFFRAQTWKKTQTKLGNIQEQIKSIKASLNLLLGTTQS
jgi:hypothetical protein